MKTTGNGKSRHQTIKQREKTYKQNFIIQIIAVTLILFVISCLVWGAKGYLEMTKLDIMNEDLWKTAFSLPIHLPKGNDWVFPLGIAGLAALIQWAYYFYDKTRLHSDLNTGKGSTMWADYKDLLTRFADYVDEAKKKGADKAKSNVILSKHMFATTNTKKHKRALNTLVLGASGSGKSRYVLKPNLLQLNTSYVITDPKGEILLACGEALRRNGYTIKILDVDALTRNEPIRSDSYNPMKYCKSEGDIKKIVKAFITNTDTSNGQGKSDPFWEESMSEFLCSCIAFLTTGPEGSDVPYAQIPEVTGGVTYEPCFANLCELTRMANAKWVPDCGIDLLEGVKLGDGKNNTANASKLAAIFENIRQYESNRQNLPPDMIVKPYALREWENFRIAPEKTSTTVLMVVAVRLGPFNIQQVRDLTSTDTLDLENFAKQKTALFLKMPATDRTYNFLLSFCYTQLFDILYRFGEQKMTGSKILRLPDGDFVKYYSKEEWENNRETKEVDNDIKALKDCHIVHNTSRPDQKGHRKDPKTKKKVAVTIHDDWYEIYDANDNLITMRPTKDLADKFVSAIKKAELTDGHAPALPIHIRMLIDEFPNIGEIPEYKEKLATVRGYEISCMTICQTITQLKGMYEKDYQVIDANSPFLIFLGGDENDNNEYLSKKMGDSTVKFYSQSIDSKKGGSASYQIDTRQIMKPEEIGRMDWSQELVLIYGEQPLQDDKYEYTEHPNYKLTNDYADECGCPSALRFDSSSLPALSTPELTHKVKIKSAVPRVMPVTIDTWKDAFRCSEVDEIETAVEKTLEKFSIENSSPVAWN